MFKMLNRIQFCFIIVIALGSSSIISASRLPDTLRLGSNVFVLDIEKLTAEEIKYILINQAGDTAYVNAVLYKDRVEHYGPDGAMISLDSLPSEPRFYKSLKGRWIFTWGDYGDSSNYYRLYNPDGSKAFDKISQPKSFESAFGLPMEKSLRFIKADYPLAKLITYDSQGSLTGGLTPFGATTTGRVFYTTDPEENFLLTAVALDTVSVFVKYSLSFEELKRSAVRDIKVSALRTSPLGNYLLIRAITSDGQQPMYITDSDFSVISQIQYPRIVNFSPDERFVAYTSIDNRVNVVETGGWSVAIAPEISSESQWSDLRFSDDSSYLVAFNGAMIVLVDLNNRIWSVTQFPFAFYEASLINGSAELIFTGDFGWAIYKRIQK